MHCFFVIAEGKPPNPGAVLTLTDHYFDAVKNSSTENLQSLLNESSFADINVIEKNMHISNIKLTNASDCKANLTYCTPNSIKVSFGPGKLIVLNGTLTRNGALASLSNSWTISANTFIQLNITFCRSKNGTLDVKNITCNFTVHSANVSFADAAAERSIDEATRLVLKETVSGEVNCYSSEQLT